MAKDKKKGTIKLPKEIAGVKVPKSLRASGLSLTEILETPAGREVLAGALVAVAGSLVGSEKVRSIVASGGEALADAAHDGTRTATNAIGGTGRGVMDTVTGAAAEAAGHELLSPDEDDDGTGDERKREKDHTSVGTGVGSESDQSPAMSENSSP